MLGRPPLPTPAIHQDEQAAAAALGFTQETWDDESAGQPPCTELDWADLTPNQRTAAETLGYTQRSWDDESAPQPPSADKDWADLFLSRKAKKPPRRRPLRIAWLGAKSAQLQRATGLDEEKYVQELAPFTPPTIATHQAEPRTFTPPRIAVCDAAES